MHQQLVKTYAELRDIPEKLINWSRLMKEASDVLKVCTLEEAKDALFTLDGDAKERGYDYTLQTILKAKIFEKKEDVKLDCGHVVPKGKVCGYCM